MMKLDPLLSKAARLAKKRDYEGALKLLNDSEDQYSGSFKYYYLYAVICLHAGSMEALENFRLAERVKMRDPDVKLGLAVYHLKHLNTVMAVDHYLEVLETDPKNKIAKNALAVMRKYPSPEALSDWITPESLKKLYPPIPSPAVSSRTLLNAALGLLGVLIIVLGLLASLKAFNSSNKAKKERPAAQFILSSQERNDPVETSGFYGYILTRDQALSLYDRALSLFTSYRDEAAKVNLNRLLESNASEALKNKARLIKQYMEVPGFDTFRKEDNPSYSEVKNEPALYRDVHVIWKGMATNIEVTDEGTGFHLLVGYDTRTTLEGIVPVFFDKPLEINSERPLEVLGRIAFSSSYSDMRLAGVAVHQSGKLEN